MGGVTMLQPGHLRRHGDGEARLAGDELVPAGHRGGRERGGAQHLQQHFAPAGRIRGQQHAARELPQEFRQRRQRLFGAQVDAPFLRRGGGKVVARGLRPRP